MSIWVALLLGAVQGIAEFLPISSSGHLSIIQNLFGLKYSSDENLLFDVMLHIGTLAAVCVFYWKDIRSMATDTIAFLAGRDREQKAGRVKPTVRAALFVVVGTLPLLIVLPFHSKIEELFNNTPFISFTLIATGFLLYLSGKLTEGRKNDRTMTTLDALTIGAAQAVATIPGLSRSGTTITVGLSCGLKRDFAVKFSFLLSIPAVLGSALVTLIDAIRTGIDWSVFPLYLVGTVVAGVVGYIALALIKRFIMTGTFAKFSYYCWGAGILSLLLYFIL